MIWAALATAIMLGSGEGDDFGPLIEFFDLSRQEIATVVDEPDRRDEAVLALNDAEVVVHYSMISARTFSNCVERADRDYRATREDYERCGRAYVKAIDEIGRRYTEARTRFNDAVLPAEQAALDQRLRERLEE